MVQENNAEVKNDRSLTEHTDLRIAMLSRGFEPIPIETETKIPNLTGWNKIELSNNVIRSWENRPDLGSTGCRTGALVGVDIALPMLQRAQQKLARSDRIRWINAPAEQLPFATGSFDGLICNNSFHYYRQPLSVLQEFHRVIQPGGTLVLADWCIDFPACRVSYWLLRLAHYTYIHRYALSRVYGLDEMSELLFTAGFAVTSAERVKMDLGWGIMVLRAQA